MKIEQVDTKLVVETKAIQMQQETDADEVRTLKLDLESSQVKQEEQAAAAIVGGDTVKLSGFNSDSKMGLKKNNNIN